jgi:chemotaxis protein CheX
METKHINAFVDSLKNVFKLYEIGKVSKGTVAVKESLTVCYDITVTLGLSGDIKGNVAFSMSNMTALNVASAMIGMTIDEIGEAVVSALSELANMVCGRACIKMISKGQKVDLTPPLLVNGKNLKVIISHVQTTSVSVESACGVVEISLGLE